MIISVKFIFLGVIVAKDEDEACYYIDEILEKKKFGAAGSTVVVEELLVGEEVSVLAFSDGVNISLMPSAQDHKRAYDNDEGPNTGGMGAYCPCPFVDDKILKQIEKEVIQRAVDGLRKEGTPFVGIVFAGIMLTPRGPKVLEYNCRFGDPETQSILPLLDSDLYDTFFACANGNLPSAIPKWKKGVTCGVVVASAGYPESAIKGQPITGLTESDEKSGILVFHAGSELKDNTLLTSGGRILSVVAVDTNLESAAKRALAGAGAVRIEKSFFRKDIGQKALRK